jgi:hypothetical protein
MIDSTAFTGWTSAQTIYFHGFETVEDVLAAYGGVLEDVGATIEAVAE